MTKFEKTTLGIFKNGFFNIPAFFKKMVAYIFTNLNVMPVTIFVNFAI